MATQDVDGEPPPEQSWGEREDVDEVNGGEGWDQPLMVSAPGSPADYYCRALSALERRLLKWVVLAADEDGTGSAGGLEVDVHAYWSEASCPTDSCQYQALHAGPCGPADGEPLPVEQVLLLDARVPSVDVFDEPCFLVKWQGWDVATFCTWEPVACMRRDWPEMVDEWLRDGSPALYEEVE